MSLHYIKTTPTYFKIIQEIYSEKLDNGLCVNMAVSTNSMSPTIVSGSIITFQKVETYNEGDIIVLKDRNNFLVHRIVKINKNIVITSGDNNFRDDDFTSVNNIMGKVVSVTGNKRSLYNFYTLLEIKIRKIFIFLFIKLKNLIFALSDYYIVKVLLQLIYKIQIIVVKTYFQIFEKENNLYLRGSATAGKLKPGLSDIDFVVLTNKTPDNKSLVSSMGTLSKITPVISFNSFLPVDVYDRLLNMGMIQSYNSYNSYKKLAGNIEHKEVLPKVKSEDLKRIQRVLQNIDHIDDIMFKFSQVKYYHPSYLFHNIKKLFNKIFLLNDVGDEFEDFKNFLNYKNRYKTLHIDTDVYADALYKIIKKIEVPTNDFEAIGSSSLSEVEINNKRVKTFTKIRRYKSYLLEDGFTHKDIFDIIKYTVEENTYPYFCGIMTRELATFLQIYNLDYILNNKFKYKNVITQIYLCDSIKLFNNYQIIKMKDRNTILGTARDIVTLCNQLVLEVNKNYQVSTELQHFLIDNDIDRDLDATGIYFKYIQQLNDLFICTLMSAKR